MITIECTSCKSALEVDERTLADRGITVLRCPSCAVTLMVDKSKAARPIVTGPVVRVAPDDHKPLSARPPDEEMAHAGATGEYVSIVASLYETATENLRARMANTARQKELEDDVVEGSMALEGMKVPAPEASSDEDARAMVARPFNREFDAKLAALTGSLTATKGIDDVAVPVWRNVLARHRYAPIITWQTQARAGVSRAYGAIVNGSRTLYQELQNVRGVSDAYDDLRRRWDTERTAFQKQIADTDAEIKKLTADEEHAVSRVNDLNAQADKKGWDTVLSAGCAGVIVAGIFAGICAGIFQSIVGAIFGFAVGIVGYAFIAHKVGAGKNSRDRLTAESTLGEVRTKLRTAASEHISLQARLAEHEAASPDVANRAVASMVWSLLICDDFDPGAKPHAVAAPAPPVADTPRLHLKPETPSLGVPATASATFIPPPVHAGASYASVAASAPAPYTAVHDPAPAVAVAAAPATASLSAAATVLIDDRAASAPKAKKNVAIFAAISGILLAIGGYFLWSTMFSLEAKMEKALAGRQFFAPQGSSLYDLYMAEHAKNPGSSVLARFTPRVIGSLAPMGDDIFSRWYKESDDTIDWPETEQLYTFLSTVSPETPMYQMRRLYSSAQQSIDAREYAKAISSYEEALKLDRSWVLALNGVGKIYMIESAPMRSEELGLLYYKRAAEADPNFTWAAKNLGDYYLRKRDFQSAEYYLQRALNASPERPSILRSMAQLCRRTRRRADAMAYYERSMQFEKDPAKNAEVLEVIAAIGRGE
jgi:tetratricopeptide (TPR) repeat protein